MKYLYIYICIYIFNIFIYISIFCYTCVCFTNTSLPIPTMSPIYSGQIRRNAAFPSFLIQRGGRVVKGLLHVSVLHLLVSLHCCPPICILISHYLLDVYTGWDLSDYLVHLTHFTIGEPEAPGH